MVDVTKWRAARVVSAREGYFEGVMRIAASSRFCFVIKRLVIA